MLKFIIRLDDACETMNESNWKKMEQLLKRYDIKPIVGIIPDNADKEFSFEKIADFWTKYALKWQKDGWIIAQHGLNHKYHYYVKKNKRIRTEFYGLDYLTQKNMLKKGYDILIKHGIKPKCFFAPNHTYDYNTEKAIKDLGVINFISDGCSKYPYVKNGVMHVPSIFDAPHKIMNNGIFTFVFHPNNINDDILKKLELFIIKYKDNFRIDLDEILVKYSKRKKTFLDYVLELLIKIYRILKGNNGNE